LYGYVDGDPLNALDPTGLYPVVAVVLPFNVVYVPMSQVKNAAQSRAIGLPVGTKVPIAVPTGVDPQMQVDCFVKRRSIRDYINFAWYWRAHGPHDYKFKNVMWDAYANFAYGAMGEANGIPGSQLQTVADMLHRSGMNDPVNMVDIQSGIDAMAAGGVLRTVDFEPSPPHH
jgi:hypothetical protein